MKTLISVLTAVIMFCGSPTCFGAAAVFLNNFDCNGGNGNSIYWMPNIAADEGCYIEILGGPDSDLAEYYMPTRNETWSITSLPIVPTITDARHNGNSFSISVLTEAAREYVLEFKNSMMDANWEVAQTLPGTGGMVTLSDDDATGSSKYYRVRVQ